MQPSPKAVKRKIKSKKLMLHQTVAQGSKKKYC